MDDAQHSSNLIEQAKANLDAVTEPHPNAATIRGLRDVADWLEVHPELPKPYYASISFGHGIAENARERLTQLADALGDGAVERVTDYGSKSVVIEGRFGPLVITAEAKATALVDMPPIPEHAPIIERREQTDDVLDVFA